MTEQDKRLALESSLFNLLNEEPFYGRLLQEMTIKYNTECPTLAICFNTKTELFEVQINPNYFINHLTPEFRKNLLNHELMHFTNKHLFRLPWIEASNEDRIIMNIAGDASINQYLKSFPKGCPKCPHESEEDFLASKCPGKGVDITEFVKDDGEPFPTFESLETYYDLIKKEQQKQQANPNTKGNLDDKLGKFHHTDVHDWEKLDEETKQKMLDEAKKVIKRTIEKTQYSHSPVPGSIQDLLEEIDVLSTKINHKKILESAIKKTVSSVDRTHTWNKPSKRYGKFAPGTKPGNLPNISVYKDTSGSISITEINKGLDILSGFLKIGNKQCQLGLWHTELYYKKKYKLNSHILEDDFKSGGTDVTGVLEDIRKTKPDLAIIFTDFYFDMPMIDPHAQILWIIYEGGNKDQTLLKNSSVIYLENLK